MPQVDHSGHRDRLREKYIQNGIEALSEHEILELLLFYAIPRVNTNTLAHKLIDEFGSLSGVFDASSDSIMKQGFTKNAAMFLKVIPDICRIYYDQKSNTDAEFSDSDGIKDFFRTKFIGRTDEYAVILFLDAKRKFKYCDIIGKGTFNAVNVDVKNVITLGASHKAVYAVIAHNHPSGNTMPSTNDINLTQTLYNSLKLINISLIDHIILSDDGAFSFDEVGLMERIQDTGNN